MKRYLLTKLPQGLYDEFGKERRMLVTGSARLDLYRFGGDSLQGRYLIVAAVRISLIIV